MSTSSMSTKTRPRDPQDKAIGVLFSLRPSERDLIHAAAKERRMSASALLGELIQEMFGATGECGVD